MRRYSHYIIPAVFSIIVSILTYLKRSEIMALSNAISLKPTLFTTSGTLFGLALTSYGIFFGLVPLLNKEIKESTTLKSVSKYFYVCLWLLLVFVITSLMFMFYDSTYILIINAFVFAYIVAMFFYIIAGMRSLFKIISN